MVTLNHPHITMKVESLTVSQSMQVPPQSCVRKMDIGCYVTNAGLSDVPGEPPNPEEVQHCIEWITLFARPQKSINHRESSYTLKHYAEDWPGPYRGYCSNGAFIEGALRLGYRFQRTTWGMKNPNCYFNMQFCKNRNSHECDHIPYLPFDDEAGGA